jgi:hypothetical protein
MWAASTILTLLLADKTYILDWHEETSWIDFVNHNLSKLDRIIISKALMNISTSYITDDWLPGELVMLMIVFQSILGLVLFTFSILNKRAACKSVKW